MKTDFIKIDQPLPFNSVYPARLGVQIDWPHTVEYKGRTYWWYDKLGLTSKTHLPCACYKCDDGNRDMRLWLSCDGTIVED